MRLIQSAFFLTDRNGSTRSLTVLSFLAYKARKNQKQRHFIA